MRASEENDKILHTPEKFSLAILIGLARAKVPFDEKCAAIAKVAAKHDAVQAALDVFKGKQPQPLTLAIARTQVPKRTADLTGVRRDQVIAMFTAWDGEDNPSKNVSRVKICPRWG